MTAVVGYARVSTSQQTLDQQHDALAEAGATRTFSDKLGGARSDRPGLAACLDYVREGDVIIVTALDRLGRSTVQVLETLRTLHDRDVIVRSLREGIDFSTPVGQAVAAIVSALAELELSLIRERAAAAREAARARGRQTGRPRVLDDSQAALARRMRSSGESVTVIATTLGISRASAYRYSEPEEATA